MNANNTKAGQFTGMTLKAILTRAGFGSLATPSHWVIALGSLLLWASSAGAADLPFKGRIDGSFVLTPTPNPAIMLSEAHAVGLTTHLGAFTKVTSDVVNIVTGETEGAFTMTAANGDHLTGVYSGFLTFGTTPI